MINELYINGKDAWTTWGVFLEDGSEAKLLLPPANKEYVENKFRSQPGKQIIPSNSQPEDRDIQLVFCISATDRKDWLRKYKAFTRELNRGLISFKVLLVETIYQFTTTSYMELSYFDRIGKLTVKFNEPNSKDTKSTLRTAYVLSSNGFVLASNKKIITENIQ